MANLVGKSLGKYHIVELLGQGGMAQVYKAAQIDLARYVAVKVIHNHPRSDDEALAAVEQFEREAIAVAGLSHPNIVPVFDFGRATNLTDAPYYMVMALIEGPTLKAKLEKRRAEHHPFNLPEIIQISNALAGAIDYAHRQNVIHRDLKPSNIMFTAEGRVVLTDFGIARLLTLPDDEDNEGIVGTPAYMSPEQINCTGIGPASDIYVLGIILYELLTGQPPFPIDQAGDIFKPLTAPVPPPSTINPAMPPSVEPVILKALNKAPEERYPSATALVQALAEASGVYTLPLIYDRRQDWGDAPAVQNFYGRHKELLNLEKWLVDDRCRLVALLGLEGMGKTSLAVKLAEQVKEHFEVTIWRSLRNAPPLDELLNDILPVLAGPALTALPVEIEPKIANLLHHLRQRRCLLVLDNLETILDQSSPGGRYQPGYQAYAELLRRVGESRLQSCLLLTSREKPPGFELLEEPEGPVRSLSLAGLDPTTGQSLLKAKGLSGSPGAWARLIDRYSGNPLALKLVAETVRQVFDGQIEAFLQEETAFFGSLRQILARQAAQLTPLEQSLLLWLAIERDGVSHEVLRRDMIGLSAGPDFVETLQALRRRSLVEKNSQGFILQNVVLEYATERLIERVCAEISQADLHHPGATLLTLNSYPLLKAQAKDYSRDSQARLILAPVVERLQATMDRAGLEARLAEILSALREARPPLTGYAAGNVLHLLMQLKSPLARFDFSNVTVRQAYLAQMGLTDVNFANANLLDIVCFDTFGGILSLAYSPNGDMLAAGTTKGEVRVWQAATGQPLFNLTGHTNWVQAVVFSPEGRRLASGGPDGTIRWWDMSSGTCLRTLSCSDNRLLSLAFHPNGQFLVSGGSDRTIRVWALETGECIQTLAGHDDWILSVSAHR
jgi:serine/threonine protein kinase